jgi:DNA-binding beta-propeller fold protein YncE
MRARTLRLLGPPAVTGALLAGLAIPASTTWAAGPAGTSPVTACVTYWNNGMTGTLVPINTVTNRAGAPIKVGEDPLTVAITPGGTSG